MDQLPRLGKRELICLLSFTCNYVVFVWRGFLFLWVLGTGYVILLWHTLSLPYNYLRYAYCMSLLFDAYWIAFIHPVYILGERSGPVVERRTSEREVV